MQIYGLQPLRLIGTGMFFCSLSNSRWLPLTTGPDIKRPIVFQLLSKTANTAGMNVSFSVEGEYSFLSYWLNSSLIFILLKVDFTGSDHLTLFLTPLAGWKLTAWSITDTYTHFDKPSHFVYVAEGKPSGPWQIWAVVEVCVWKDCNGENVYQFYTQ